MIFSFSAFKDMQRLLNASQKAAMARRVLRHLPIDLHFNLVGQHGGDKGISPDEGNLRPGDGSDEAKTVSCQQGGCQFGDYR